MARRWRTKPKLPADKFRLTQKDGWWTAEPLKPAKAKAPKPQVPADWVGDTTVRGSYKKPPRLNPDTYEWAQDPTSGRYFARPRTELSGLDPDSRFQVKSYDNQTAAQQDQIARVNTEAAAGADARAAANAQRLQNFQAMSGTVGNATDPTAVRLAGLNSAGNTAANAPVLASTLRMPELIRDAGSTRVTTYGAERVQGRNNLIGGLRTAQSEAEAARSEAAAKLRDQNLQVMLKLMGLDSDANIAALRSNTQLAGYDAQNQRTAAQIASNETIQGNAEAGRNARTAAQLENSNKQLAARISADIQKNGALTPSTRNTLLTRGQAMVNGVKVTKPNGTSGVLTYNYGEVVRFFIAAGVPAAQAKQMAIAAGAVPPPKAMGTASGSVNVGPDRPGSTGGGGF